MANPKREMILLNMERTITTHPKRKSRALYALLVVVLFVSRPAWTHMRAAALLLRFSEDGVSHGFARVGMHDVKEEDAQIDLGLGRGATPGRGRYYIPEGVRDAPGIVVCHGVHHLGMDEPRMMKFARAIASTGVVVLTPELKELADYRIDPVTIATIGRAALALRTRVQRSEVGVLGLSFAGGLALLAAADAQYERAISFVVAVGADDDLERVARFFVEDEIAEPDGTTLHLHAHGYGSVVLLHMYAQSFFKERDVAQAREALRLWLWEQFDDARAVAKKLSPEGQEKMALIFDHRETLRPEIERVIAAHGTEMKRVSPHDALDGLRARVFLLHGEGDTVIPASETRWLVHDLPKGALADAVVSRAIVHVDLEGKPTWKERYELVHLLAGVIDAADTEGMAAR
jgi:pimeloyl-ACP methyl ester carboxylesterase